MLRLASDGTCTEVKPKTVVVVEPLVRHEVDGVVLHMHAKLYQEDDVLFQLPLPMPFGGRLLAEPVHWSTNRRDRVTSDMLDHALSALIERATPVALTEPLTLDFDVHAPYTEEASEDEIDDDDEIEEDMEESDDDDEESDDDEDVCDADD